MKKTKLTLRLLLILVAGALTFSSCHKKEKEVVQTTDTEQGTANDNNLAENIDSDIETMGSQVSENGSLTTFRTNDAGITMSGEDLKLSATCATVSGVGTKTIVVNFGAGCTGNDGRTRSGMLIYNFSASNPTTAVYYRNPGFSMTVSSQNYIVDNYQVNINSKTVTNTTSANIPQGPNPGINLTWAVNANISIIKPNNAGTITWTCNRTKTLVNTANTSCYQGQGTPINWGQAQVQISGTASGTNTMNETFSATATNLLRDFTCPMLRKPFTSGTISYTPGNRPTRVVNFGSGSCDFNATLTIGTQTFNIILP